MKSNKILLAVATLTLVGASATSCLNDKDFLKENSFEWSDATYFNSENAMIQALNACYAEVEYLMAGNSHGQHSWMLQGMGLDTFTGTSGTAEWAANWPAVNNGNGTTRHWFDYLYQLNNRCNTVIDMIDENTDVKYSTPDMKAQLRAEAVMLRAWGYRCLASMYGNAPIITKRVTEVKFDYVPNTRQEIWEFLYDELKYAENNLPTVPRLTGTVTKAAAATYLAEICLDLGKFKEAEEAALRVINKKCGDYQIMKTRFGSRANEAKDRYGNSLAAPAGAYWDLFREGGNQDLESGNKEAIWTIQYNYGTFETGGGGDSWWRVHSQATEAAWTSGLLVGHQGVATIKNGKQVYKYGDNIACFAPGSTATSAAVAVVKSKFTADTKAAWEKAIKEKKAGDPALWYEGLVNTLKIGDEYEDLSKFVETAKGRKIANIATDSLGARVSYLGQVCVPTRYMWDKTVPGFNLWEDENDFRGSETMIQRNWYTVGGTRFLDEKKAMYDRQKAGGYVLTAGDTMNVFIPRFWKFSDDKHPVVDGVVNNKAYDQELYMIRMPEVYFLLAEAYLAQNNKGQAASALNEVRSRANAKPCTEKDINIDYILDERARELMGEEHRWVTLNRLSCNPNCTYIADRYPVQDNTTSNTMYERVRKYGRGFENVAPNPRDPRTDGYGAFYSNITPHSYLFPIPTQVIDSNSGYPYPQNPGY